MLDDLAVVDAEEVEEGRVPTQKLAFRHRENKVSFGHDHVGGAVSHRRARIDHRLDRLTQPLQPIGHGAVMLPVSLGRNVLRDLRGRLAQQDVVNEVRHQTFIVSRLIEIGDLGDAVELRAARRVRWRHRRQVVPVFDDLAVFDAKYIKRSQMIASEKLGVSVFVVGHDDVVFRYQAMRGGGDTAFFQLGNEPDQRRRAIGHRLIVLDEVLGDQLLRRLWVEGRGRKEANNDDSKHGDRLDTSRQSDNAAILNSVFVLANKPWNDHWVSLRTEELSKAAMLVAVVRGGSFAAGARALGVARSTASEQIASLEASLGVRLLERTTRSIRLTDEGSVLFEQMERVLRGWQQAREALAGRLGEPTGTLKVTTVSGSMTGLVAPVCGGMVRDFPGLHVELLVDDRIRDLVGEGIDVAVRMAPLEDSSLICKKLGETPRVVVAAPELVREVPADVIGWLRTADWVEHAEVPTSQLVLEDPEGQRHTLRPRYRARGSNTEAQIGLLTAAAGVAVMPEALVGPSLQSGALTLVAPGWRASPLPVYTIHSRSKWVPPRVRQFLDRLADAVAI